MPAPLAIGTLPSGFCYNFRTAETVDILHIQDTSVALENRFLLAFYFQNDKADSGSLHRGAVVQMKNHLLILSLDTFNIMKIQLFVSEGGFQYHIFGS